MNKNFQEISLSRISTNPNNPRKNFLGPAFDELIASIREKGVIEPIIVRPTSNGKADYEVVAGERRFRAASLIAEEKKGKRPDNYSRIPAIIRELTDEEAFDFMIIENLQREDLTSFEEAQSYKSYFEKKGKGSIVELAQRIGKSPGYIRRKIAVLSLPQDIVKTWEKEELQFSHLEQLRRLKNKEELDGAFKFATGKTYYRGDKPSKRELKEYIDNMAPALSAALFDVGNEGCTTCGQNSEVQKKEWEIEGMKGPHCLDKNCFKQKQNNFLLKNWKQSKYRRRFGTNGFRFSGSVANRWAECNIFRNWGPNPAKKCKTCDKFLSIINIDGSIDEGEVCFGDDSCFNSIGRKAAAEKIQQERREREESGEPRVTWHGEHFREEFLKKRLPERYQEFEHSHIKMARASLFAFVKLNGELLRYLSRKIKLKDSHLDKKLFERIEKMELDEIQEFMKQCALKVIKGWPVQHEGRLEVAEHLGIDLMKEFAVTQEYLEKKTIREMLEFGEKSRIFKNKKAQDYLTKTFKKKPGQFDKCKKTELIDIFLKSGVNLVGKVPDEIIPKKRS